MDGTTVTVTIEARPDGGVRIFSDEVPGLVLSSADVEGAFRDLRPAVETILSARMGETVVAEPLNGKGRKMRRRRGPTPELRRPRESREDHEGAEQHPARILAVDRQLRRRSRRDGRDDRGAGEDALFALGAGGGMNMLAPIKESSALPALIDRAASALSNAKSAAEVLEARELAGFAYDAAKRAGRLAKAKEAHDSVLAEVYRAQADALLIEARAKMLLADEYDAAQERGEVQRHGGQGKRDVLLGNIPSVSDIGLSRKNIHEARVIRDAERADPGITERTVNDLVQRGEEPTKAKQSKDEELMRMATRIRDRAIRRAGELLQQIKPARGANQNITGDAPPKVLTRKQAAADAGMSEDQGGLHRGVQSDGSRGRASRHDPGFSGSRFSRAGDGRQRQPREYRAPSALSRRPAGSEGFPLSGVLATRSLARRCQA